MEFSADQKTAEEQLRKALSTNIFLASAGSILASTLDLTESLQTIAQLVVPQLADWCGIYLKQADGPPKNVAVAHSDPEMLKWMKKLQEEVLFDWNGRGHALH